MTPPNDRRVVRPALPGPLEAWKHARALADEDALDEYSEAEQEQRDRWNPRTPYNPHFPGGLVE